MAASKSVKKQIAALPDPRTAEPMRALLNAVLADNTALRTQLAAAVADLGTLRTAFNTAMTKLNADAGVTDTNYAAAAALTAAAPAALTLLA